MPAFAGMTKSTGESGLVGEKIERFFINFGEMFKLHGIHPPFAGLAFGHIGLGLLKESGHSRLSEPRLLSCLVELVKQGVVFLSIN